LENLVEGVRTAGFTKWGKPEIRALLIDNKSKRLEAEYVVLEIRNRFN